MCSTTPALRLCFVYRDPCRPVHHGIMWCYVKTLPYANLHPCVNSFIYLQPVFVVDAMMVPMIPGVVMMSVPMKPLGIWW